MKKSEAKKIIHVLFDQWRKECGFSQTPTYELSFYDFYDWVQNHYAQVLRFRTTTSVQFDVEMWFDVHFEQLMTR